MDFDISYLNTLGHGQIPRPALYVWFLFEPDSCAVKEMGGQIPYPVSAFEIIYFSTNL